MTATTDDLWTRVKGMFQFKREGKQEIGVWN